MILCISMPQCGEILARTHIHTPTHVYAPYVNTHINTCKQACFNVERFSLHLASYPPPLPLPPYGQGFLGAELVGEACRGLHKRCVAASEQLMQSMESIDTMVRQHAYATVYNN